MQRTDQPGSGVPRPGIAGTLLAIAVLAMAGTAVAQELEEIVVTAQKREVGLQTAPVAISAYSGDTLEQNKIYDLADLANSVPAFSLTALTPLDVELNIRGVTNTRLDAPTADPSVGLFLDEVYIGRTGGLNTDFYDLERVEIIRGPQGVLLGKNVVGGALSVITAAPEFERSGKLLVSAGNFNALQTSGHITGGLSDSWAGRLSFQTRDRDGYAHDVLHDRELEDLTSRQIRGQLLYENSEGLRARFSLDYNDDATNGMNAVAIAGGPNGFRPWSSLRSFLGLTDIRQSTPEDNLYAGEQWEQNNRMTREGFGLMANVEKDFGGFTFTSITGYRDAKSKQLYDQTGGGPDVFDDVADFDEFLNYVGDNFGPCPLLDPTGTDPRGCGAVLLFSSPVNEQTDIKQFSQEFRLTSTTDGRWDWIAGVYYKHDEIDKFDRFFGENITGALPTLSGESHWLNDGEMDSFAVFGQVGWNLTDTLKLSVGARWTRDDKKGTVQGIAVATGDRFNPGDAIPLTPLGATFVEGGGFTTDYGDDWSEVTPQAILEWQATDQLFLYASVAKGFKGGGFEDTPSNEAAANFAFDPEEVINYEAGFKSDFADGRARLNASFFFMDYTDLQVQQTNEDCLCNLTDNASDAEILGVEAEFQYAATEGLLISASGSFVDTEYVEFIEASGFDSSGNQLQRTPELQYSVGFDYTPAGASGPARDLAFRLGFTWQDELFWQPSNLNREGSYGLLDGRITYAPENANWSLGIWGKNLTDEEYRLNIIPFFGEEVSQFGPPRTYGVDFTYNFL